MPWATPSRRDAWWYVRIVVFLEGGVEYVVSGSSGRNEQYRDRLVGIWVPRGKGPGVLAAERFWWNWQTRESRRESLLVKRVSAHGGCLGTDRRGRTWQAAKSFGELQAS